MGRRRVSARNLSMSRAAKEHLKKKKRNEKSGVPKEEPETTGKGIWIFVIAVFLVVVLLMAWYSAS